MKHIVFTGPSNSGKTSSVGRLTHRFIKKGYTVVKDAKTHNPSDTDFYGIPKPGQEFYVVLEKNNQYILSYSWSDTEKFIKWILKYLKELSEKGIIISLIIMASRDRSDNLYSFTQNTMGFNEENRLEVPLGRMVRGHRRKVATNWYLDSIFKLVDQYVLPNYFDDAGL